MARLYILGSGPGHADYIIPSARKALEHATDIVAYSMYLDLLGEIIDGKIRHELSLGEEKQRAQRALELAASGKVTALVSSGDAGIYAMATVVFELLAESTQSEWNQVEIIVIPGISAVQAIAAKMGAPLSHDFCTISLSDLLTPWTTIETRLHAAGQGDFVVALYNPVSRKRRHQLDQAKTILMQYRPAQTPVILGRQVGRVDEKITTLRLDELETDLVDMLTLVLIGNSETRITRGWVYTPRGYSKRLS